MFSVVLFRYEPENIPMGLHRRILHLALMGLTCFELAYTSDKSFLES